MITHMQTSYAERKILSEKNRNKKLVKTLKHKMFKGFIDVKNAKWFQNKKPRFVSDFEWSNKIFDPFDLNYNLNYKSTKLAGLKGPDITNLLLISSSKKTKNKICGTNILSARSSGIKSRMSNKKTIGKINSNNESNKSLNDGLYITAQPFYKPEMDPVKVYPKIFTDGDDPDLYSNLPIVSIEKTKNYKMNSKSQKKDIINTSNIFNKYNGLTIPQFLYKISHKELGKEKVEPSISLRTDKNIYKGFVCRRIQSANTNINNKQLLYSLAKNKIFKNKDVVIDIWNEDDGTFKIRRIVSGNKYLNKKNITDLQGKNMHIYSHQMNELTRPNSSITENLESNKTNKLQILTENYYNNFYELNNSSKSEYRPRITSNEIYLKTDLIKKQRFKQFKKIMTCQ